ncbi:MAG: hypothetical protein VKJ64_11185 [Leptolyngbyaceae bacterium]|nr:hypothetical protein [Leptolyngbyaceae bacterium]
MYTIDISLKHSPVSLSVQRKEEADAQAVYNQVLNALRSQQPQVLELTCEKMDGKTIGVVVAEISAVQLTEKSGISPTGKPPGFAALLEA